MRVITDIEGLKEEIGRVIRPIRGFAVKDDVERTIEIVQEIIDAHTITAPDLVRREDVLRKNYECGLLCSEEIAEVPEWDGKE
jgi:hypothetical protein